MVLSIDPEVLLAARLTLLREEQSITAVEVSLPAAGATAGPTTGDRHLVGAVVAALALDLRALAVALADLAADVERREHHVGAAFAGLRERGTA